MSEPHLPPPRRPMLRILITRDESLWHAWIYWPTTPGGEPTPLFNLPSLEALADAIHTALIAGERYLR